MVVLATIVCWEQRPMDMVVEEVLAEPVER
jgi:hypothetical protein